MSFSNFANDISSGKVEKSKRGSQIWGPFLESPDNFSGPESCFGFVMFVFKIKVLIILKIIK